VVIRAARREDGAAIVALIEALAEFEHLPGPSDEAKTRLVEHGFGARPWFESLVAEEDGAVVAYAIFLTTYSTFVAKPTLFLEDLFVHPRVRRRGIGTALMQRLRALAVERDCGRFEWTVLDWNAGAQAFYAKLGAERLDAWRICRVVL